MIDEPSDLPMRRVLTQVHAGWDESVSRIEHAPAGTTAHHWVVHDTEGPRWFVTADPVQDAAHRRRLVAAYATAAELAIHLGFVLPPEYDKVGRIGIDLSPGYLMTVASYVTARLGAVPEPNDEDRIAVAGMLGELHTFAHPRTIRPWHPRIGWRGEPDRAALLSRLDATTWNGGPLSRRAHRLVSSRRELVRTALDRFDLLAAAVLGAPERWVVTHGAPSGNNVLHCDNGPRLVDWESVALAPRERDLRHVTEVTDVTGVPGATGATGATGPRSDPPGDDVLWAYVEAGGPPSPLSPDTLELFALEAHLDQVAQHALCFDAPHAGDAEDRRSLRVLEAELTALNQLQTSRRGR